MIFPTLYCPRCGDEMYIIDGSTLKPTPSDDMAVCERDRLGILLRPSVRDISKFEWITMDPAELMSKKG